MIMKILHIKIWGMQLEVAFWQKVTELNIYAGWKVEIVYLSQNGQGRKTSESNLQKTEISK